MKIRSEAMELQRHEFFEDIIAHSKSIFGELGFSEEVAEQAGISFVDFICDNWAGQYFTIPIDYQYKLALRDLEMYNFHRGDFLATARHFKMTERGCRKAIERVRKRMTSKLQGDLFNHDDSN